jgi:hypothetical protein
MLFMEPASYQDLMLLLAVVFVLTACALAVMALLLERSLAETRRLIAEDQRLTRAVGGLVVKEAEKIKALVREHS